MPILKKEHIYGYAIVQRPYYVPISSTSVHYGTNSVYMSCYGTINGDATHHYVNGDFLAEKLLFLFLRIPLVSLYEASDEGRPTEAREQYRSKALLVYDSLVSDLSICRYPMSNIAKDLSVRLVGGRTTQGARV